MLRDDEILAALRSSSDVQGVAARLVHLANERGGEDNITAIVLAFE